MEKWSIEAMEARHKREDAARLKREEDAPLKEEEEAAQDAPAS